MSTHPLTRQLQALAACKPLHQIVTSLALSEIITPLHWRTWEEALCSHPDKTFSKLIVEGIREGFRIGFNYNRFHSTKSCNRNMASAYEHPIIVSEYLEEECKEGRVLGPFLAPPIAFLRISRFGVIPKRNQANKWRLIVDLSSPTDHSVNDGIDPQLCSLSYTSVDEIAACVLKLGRGAQIAKSDIKHAYRQIPVHPQDRILLGMQWQGRYYIDATLPFGLRSAPINFSAVADALEWVVRSSGVEHIFHYIDDFVIVGKGDEAQCEFGLQSLMQACNNLGLVVADEKTEGPSSRITRFLALSSTQRPCRCVFLMKN